MGITYGDHLIDSGHYDITPEQEREIADEKVKAACSRLAENLASFDAEVAFQLSTEGERADLWTDIDVNVEDLRTVLANVCPHDCYRPGDCDGWTRHLAAPKAQRFCGCANSVTDNPCIVCGKPKLATREWAAKMAEREGDHDPTTGLPDPLMDRVWEAYWQPDPHGTQAALERVVALVHAESAATIERMAARNVELAKYAKDATIAITGLTVGGSEFFSKQLDEGFYTADLTYCVDHIRGRFAKGHEAQIAAVKAETNCRHWREECGKLHAKLRIAEAALATHNEAQSANPGKE